MAFALQNEDDQPVSQLDANNPQGQGGTGVGVATAGSLNQQNQGGGVSLGGAGSAVSGSQPAAGGQPGGGNVGGPLSYSAAPAQTQSNNNGQWTNVQDYLNANSDQSQQLGNQISSHVANQAQNAENDVTNASQDFTNQVNAGTVQANPNSINQDIADAQNLTAGQTYSQSDLNDFQTQANANYTGPTDFTTNSQYGQAQNSVNNASQSLSQLGSEAGRDVLLQNQYGNASPTGYTHGESNLDQLLLEGNPANQTAMQNVRNQYSGINSILSNATNQNNAAAQAAVTTNQNTAAGARAALANANTQFQTGIQNQTNTAQTNHAQSYSDIMAAIGSNQINPEQLQQLGLNPGTQLWGMTPQQVQGYITQGAAPTMYNTATANQYAQAAALARLGGAGGVNYLPTANASQAGTAGPAFTFNTSQFNNDLASRAANAQTAFQSANQVVAQHAPWLPSVNSQTPEQSIQAIQNFNKTGDPSYDQEYDQPAIDALQNYINLYHPEEILGRPTAPVGKGPMVRPGGRS